LVLVLAILLTIVLTYPFARDWRTAVPGGQTSDAYNFAWSFWWSEKAAFTIHQSPAEMDWIYYPVGAYHPKELASLYPKLITVSLMRSTGAGPLIAYNLNLFLATVLTVVFMAWLCLELTGSRIAGLLGGMIFAFSANRTMHLLTGHFSQSLTYLYPILLLAALWMWRRPTPARGFTFGVCLAMSALLDLMPMAYFFGPVIAGVLLYFALSDRERFTSCAFRRSLLVALLVALFLVAPFYYPLLASALRGELDWYESIGVVEFSADLLAFFIPPPQHTLARIIPGLEQLSQDIYGFGVSRLEGTVYFGWTALILGLIGIVSGWEQKPLVRYWLTLTFATMVLALGPWLRVRGQFITVGEQTVIMPYAVLLYLPLLSWGRTPGRFGLTAVFGVAILAALGATWLLAQVKHAAGKTLLTVGLIVLILYDSVIIWPWPMSTTPVPDFYQELAADQRSVAVLDMPVEGYVEPKRYMYYQTLHGHAIVGGWRDRRSPEVEVTMLELQTRAEPGGNIQALAKDGIGYIVLHKQFLDSERLLELGEHLSSVIGPPVFDDDAITAYKLVDVAEVAPKPVLVD
jgi:hypothetical protein